MRIFLNIILLLLTLSLFGQPDSSRIGDLIHDIDKNVNKGPGCKRGVFDTIFYLNSEDRYKADHVIIWNKIDTQLLRSYDLYKSDSNIQKIYYRTDYLTDTSCDYKFSEFKHYRNYLTGSVSHFKIIEIKSHKKTFIEYLNFKDGYLNGDYALYYPNGMPAVIGFYHENLRAGLWQYYHDNGQLLTKGYYENDVVIFVKEEDDYFRVLDNFYRITEWVDATEANMFISKITNCSNPTEIPGVFFFRKGWWNVYGREGQLVRKQKFKYGRLVVDK